MSLLLLYTGYGETSTTVPFVVAPLPVPRVNVEYVLCDSLTMDRLGDMPSATARSLRLVWKGAGSAAFSLDFSDDMASFVSPITTCLKVIVDDVTVWSGPVWTRQGSASTRKLVVNCVGWLQAADKRELHAPVAYTEYDYQIASDLTDVINAQDPVHPLRLDYAGQIGSTFQTRTRSYQRGQKYGAALLELSTIEAGYDLVVDYDTKQLYAQATDAWEDHPDLVFERLADPSFLESAEHFTNSLTATGTSSATPGFAEDDASIAVYGRCDDTQALSDVADSGILAAYAAEELIVEERGTLDPVARPPLFYDIKPSNDPSDPQIFTDFQIGEGVRFSADFGLFYVDKQAVRVFTAGMNFGDNGDVQITELQTSASSS